MRQHSLTADTAILLGAFGALTGAFSTSGGDYNCCCANEKSLSELSHLCL
jgi:hypothetical protein